MTIEPADPASETVSTLLAAYFAELEMTFGYDHAGGVITAPEDFQSPLGCFLVVRDDTGTPVGCGGVRLIDASTAEVKRMWLHPDARGRGLGRDLLAALEQAANDLGARRCVLDTNATLTSALRLYRSAGWREVEAYNDNTEATHWFAKTLGDVSAHNGGG